MSSRSTFVRLAILVPVAGTSALIACGSSSPTKVIDAAVKKDAGSGSGSCALAASYSPTFTASTGTMCNGTECALNDGSGTGYTQELEWQGVLGGSGSAGKFMDMQAYSGGGTTGSGATPDWPTGNVTAKSGINMMTTMDVLFFIGTGLNGSGQPSIIYVATSGTLNINTVTPNFSGSASNLVFQHYDINGSGQITGADPDMCMTTVSSITMPATPIDTPTAGGIKVDPQWMPEFVATRAAQ